MYYIKLRETVRKWFFCQKISKRNWRAGVASCFGKGWENARRSLTCHQRSGSLGASGWGILNVPDFPAKPTGHPEVPRSDGAWPHMQKQQWTKVQRSLGMIQDESQEGKDHGRGVMRGEGSQGIYYVMVPRDRGSKWAFKSSKSGFAQSRDETWSVLMWCL